VKEIGGKTYTPKNLYDVGKFEGGSGYSDGGGWVYEGKIQITTSGGGGGYLWWGAAIDRYNDTFDSEPTPLTELFDVEIGKTYTIGCISKYGSIVLGEYAYFQDEVKGGFRVRGGERKTFVLTEELNKAGISFQCIDWESEEVRNEWGDITYTIDLIELYEGAGVEPYDMKVTALEIVGRNRLAPNYPLLKSATSVYSVDISPLPNGDIILNGTATNNVNIFLFGNDIEKGGDERLYLEPGNYHVVDTGNPDAYFLLKWQLSGGGSRGTLTLKDTDEYSKLGYTFNLRIKKGGSFNNTVIHPYILKGSNLPTELPEYTCMRFEIPEEVQNLAGYGKGAEDVYNRIEWNGDGTSQYIAYIDENGNKLETPLTVDTTEYFGKDNFLEVE
jgi:hypothetical protein